MEVFCTGHSNHHHFDNAISNLRNDFSVDCFTRPEQTSHVAQNRCGAFAGGDALLPLLDHQKISEHLRSERHESYQLMALYALRGLSCDELLDFVTIDEYVLALQRYPRALFAAWFEKDASSHVQLNSRLAHCAAATGQVVCLRACNGELLGWATTCQMIDLVAEDRSTLLHSHGCQAWLSAVAQILAEQRLLSGSEKQGG